MDHRSHRNDLAVEQLEAIVQAFSVDAVVEDISFTISS
jgi:hypothetical protein